MIERTIYLTFDDGPNEPYTSEILGCLKLHGAQATFFVCGKNIERDPKSLQKIAASGNAIGNHAYSHSWLKTCSQSLHEEFVRTDKLITETIGRKTNLVRPPWGLMTRKVARQLKAEEYVAVPWDISAYDWWQPSADYIARSIIRQAFDGCIILLHDGQKTEPHKSRARTVEALKLLIPRLQEEGFTFKAL